jgi:uncharacterized coiled-coil DUF342 family protein
MTQTAASSGSFDRFVRTELEIVRSSEERLERLFAKLRLNPQLENCFLQELAAVRKRAERLDAILNGFEPIQAPVLSMPAV